jgi:hypothetical protein
LQVLTKTFLTPLRQFHKHQAALRQLLKATEIGFAEAQYPISLCHTIHCIFLFLTAWSEKIGTSVFGSLQSRLPSSHGRSLHFPDVERPPSMMIYLLI